MNAGEKLFGKSFSPYSLFKNFLGIYRLNFERFCSEWADRNVHLGPLPKR